ncbi:MAG TPA: hypothetical protein VNH41_00545 [Steroidobacteraceae bacterium]|jgi:hypothetical protein|nr:hypothetical protein [Steroidobacteraceae bacterium]
MPVMLIVLALQMLQGLTPAAGALFALPLAIEASDGAAVIEQAMLR